MLQETHITFSGSSYIRQELEEAGYETILASGLAQYEADSGKPGRGYYTILDDGFRHDVVTLLIGETYPEFILVYAAEEDKSEAINAVIGFNHHLSFLPLSVVEGEGEPPDAKRTYKLFFEVYQPAAIGSTSIAEDLHGAE